MTEFLQEYGCALICFGLIVGVAFMMWFFEGCSAGFKGAWKRVWMDFF